MTRFGVNIEQVALLRGESALGEPDPVSAAVYAESGGADGIVCTLRDGLHSITERDVKMLKGMVKTHFTIQIPPVDKLIAMALSVAPDMILPYDDVKKAILKAKSFALFDCTCRVTRDMKGDRPCDFPVKNCLQLYYEHRDIPTNAITKEEALAVLDEAEAVGLVHTGTNYIKEMHWICNCCGCCCNLIRNLTEEGLDGAIAKANYYAVAQPDNCDGCELCVTRCPVKAVRVNDGIPVIELSGCIGCGLCVTGCPTGTLALVRKPEDEIEDPPMDEQDFNQRRLRNRGLL